MDPTGTNTKFIDFQSQTKYFFDVAQQCFDMCIKDFESKDLSNAERGCTKACFSKQMAVYGSLIGNLQKTAEHWDYYQWKQEVFEVGEDACLFKFQNK